MLMKFASITGMDKKCKDVFPAYSYYMVKMQVYTPELGNISRGR
jgi:hypothetical protein